MVKKVSIVLVGAGGYGNIYISELLNNIDKGKFTIVGIVDPNPQGCKYIKELEELKIPFFKAIEEFYADNNAELAVISTPIQYHAYQSCYAMMHGSNVLCEKPVGATIQDALKMAEVRDKTGKFLAIGYQLCFSDAVLELKRDIIAGKLGRPKKLKTVVLWPRDKKYFSRKWAAKIKDEFGNWVLDSVANNATAHYLNNMFFVLGEKEDESTYPSEVKAELYRANDIENFDTVAAKISTEKGVDIMFYASHAVNESIGPIFYYEFENAVVTYTNRQKSNCDIIAQFSDGTIRNYGNPFENVTKKLWTCIGAAAGLSVDITCKVETAIPHIICINGMQKSVPEIVNFPASLIKTEGDPELVWVEGLKELLLDCYDNWTLPSDKEIPWAKVGKKIKLTGYKCFDDK
jgi:predicted dehydrogenase